MKQIPQPTEPTALEQDIRRLINTHSREGDSDTPDYILAMYLMACLEAFETAIAYRHEFYRGQKCPPHDFVSRGDGTAHCADCGETCDISETGAARKGHMRQDDD